MADKNLTAKDILNKEFSKSIRGYTTAEVDEYLDNIIRDYDSYQKDVAHLRSENDRLMHKIEELSKQLSQAKHSTSATIPNTNVSNFDILKRLSHLEKHVFGQNIGDE